MLSPFFSLAMLSPGRQQALRRAVVAHLAALAGAVWALAGEHTPGPALVVGSALLLAGIVEGAVLVGWRLTQLPRSQALEFLLVSPLHPRRVFLAEALVGLARLALVTISGLPVLAVLMVHGMVAPADLVPLLLMPFTWGAVTGLGLTVWAYEAAAVRRWGQRLILGSVIGYLVVGVLAAEQLGDWADHALPGGSALLRSALRAFLDNNPFGVLKAWQLSGPAVWPRAAALEGAGVALAGLLLWRGAARLTAHFNERHYHAAVDDAPLRRRRVGERPLAWWAVKRVTQYAGRINVWLAGGYCGLYALYVLAGPSWPTWLGRQAFVIIDNAGGLSGVATAMVVLGAVPAAFQYGLWDTSAQDRCRRLELLLLTRLTARDYWEAAAAAAWHRGQGYLSIAVVLWGVALGVGQVSVVQAAAATAGGVLLWCLYFTLGFWAFSRGLQANGLGLFLTLGLPLAAYGSERSNLPWLAALLPPGSVYAAAARPPDWLWAAGPVVTALFTLLLVRRAMDRCLSELRLWYERHHGSKVMG